MKIAKPWIAVLAIALSACASRQVHEALPPIAGSPQARQAERESQLAAQTDWSLSGRVALANGKDGGSGRLEWTQSGARFDVSLSAPVTRQSWRVVGGDGEARLEGMEGGTRTGADAETLIFDATRWRIPVDALVRWVRGRASPGATLAYAADGRLRHLDEAGWTVDYDDWRTVDGVELPGRIEARQGDARVRLVVDQWSPGGAVP